MSFKNFKIFRLIFCCYCLGAAIDLLEGLTQAGSPGPPGPIDAKQRGLGTLNPDAKFRNFQKGEKLRVVPQRARKNKKMRENEKPLGQF